MTPAGDAREVRSYHEHTKHSMASMFSGGHALDWDNQPDPFRRYEGAPLIALSRRPELPRAGTFATLRALGERDDSGRAIDRETLSALLYHSMAVSAWKELKGHPESRWSLRVNPSSGNLHPTELYLCVQATGAATDLEPGLYHYRADVHALERRGDAGAGAELAGPFRLVLALTSIFWREAWKYRARAYRYCLHDAGHAAGSILAAARALGLPGVVLGHFADARVERLLGLDKSDEQPLLVLGLGAAHASGAAGAAATAARAAVQRRPQRFLGVPNALSSDVIEYRLIHAAHAATRRDDDAPCPRPPARPFEGPAGGPEDATQMPLPVPLVEDVPQDDPLGAVARRRRSAVDYDPSARMSFAACSSILRHAQVPWRADFRGNTGAETVDAEDARDGVRLVAYVHRVDGVEPGAYVLDRRAGALRPLLRGDQRAWARSLSLGQEIGADSVMAFSILGDFEGALAAFGDRGYRYLHFEAGFVGQNLYLGAEAAGFQATGIGAFFDDEVHRHVGLGPREGQVIYHFSIGRAVFDERIVQTETEPLPAPGSTGGREG